MSAALLTLLLQTLYSRPHLTSSYTYSNVISWAILGCSIALAAPRNDNRSADTAKLDEEIVEIYTKETEETSMNTVQPNSIFLLCCWCDAFGSVHIFVNY